MGHFVGDHIELSEECSKPTLTSASTSPRKSLVVTTSVQVPTIAEHIQLVRVDPSMLTRALVELRNQYLLKVNADQPTSGLDQTLQL